MESDYIFMVYQALQRSPHSLRVCRLYRRILKEQMNWLAHRGLWVTSAMATRNAFRANVGLNSIQAENAIKDANEQLNYWKHPNPIINPNSEGGCVYQRNAPPPYDSTMNEAFVEWQ